MRVVPVAASWVHGFPPAAAADEELAQRFARLLAALAGEVLEALKRVENSEPGGRAACTRMHSRVCLHACRSVCVHSWPAYGLQNLKA